MRFTLRFVLPLIVVLGLLAYGAVPLVDRLIQRWSVRDLDARARLIATSVRAPLGAMLADGSSRDVERLFSSLTHDERLVAMGWCASPDTVPVATPLLPAEVGCAELRAFPQGGSRILHGTPGLLHVAIEPVVAGDNADGALLVVQDMGFIQSRGAEGRRYLFLAFIGLSVVVSFITVVVAQLSWRGWVAGMQALLRGEGLLREPLGIVRAPAPEFRPIARDLARLIREFESEARARDESQITWSAETLRGILHGELRGEDVIVVSNREPYLHEHREGRIETRRPASGLVTALEPIMRACSGTWIAHGSGTADREVVDSHDSIALPPDQPAYRLRRVWLSPEEEQGYYYGFANEGLWPLCHAAHIRPIFRSEDFAHYTVVNRRFAEAVIAEAKTEAPIVLVQDYHLALLPRMVREALPGATVITFWHIPWPTAEAFAICPWREDLLAGLLGSSILGFHVQSHCNNFLATVDDTLEARVDREAFTVSYGGKLTAVRRYPISVDWPPPQAMVALPVEECRRWVRSRAGLAPSVAVGVGVDRLDYTKGIIERFRAVERLLELRPEWAGRFSYIQVAAPSRSTIPEYRRHEEDVRAMAERINGRFGEDGWRPIILAVEHVEPREVYRHYRGADFCFVGSLHDGMNLVAKEFISARDDDRGVLILSQFTGAARELPEALVVNPYDADQCAVAIEAALTMPQSEQRDRMRLMRALVAEFNVYRWAGRMLLDAALMRRRGRVPARTLAPSQAPAEPVAVG